MEKFAEIVAKVDSFVWGPVMLALLVGTGIYLTIRTRFLTWRNLPFAIKLTLSRETRTRGEGEGDISPFAALATALASTIGTGNIVGVATALVAGGPGALVWMQISACFGISTKFAECMLAIKYREKNANGEMLGGPMITMKNGIKNKTLGAVLGWLFALFTLIACFGIGNLTQCNSIADSMAQSNSFGIPTWVTGIALTILSLVIICGGIKAISKVSSVLVPLMAILYVVLGLVVICYNWRNIPGGVANIFTMAFGMKAFAGGLAGSITASIMEAMRFGIARGCFSNEAGLGSAAISASACTTNSPVRQGYVNMTGTFWDTLVVCTLTGLILASSGLLGTVDPATGAPLKGAALTSAAFCQVYGPLGAKFVSLCILLFAYSTVLGWEYNGEKAFEHLLGTHKLNIIFRLVFTSVIYFGCTTTMELAWNIADIFNALMCVPNLICLLLMSGEIAKDIVAYQAVLKEERAAKAAVTK